MPQPSISEALRRQDVLTRLAVHALREKGLTGLFQQVVEESAQVLEADGAILVEVAAGDDRVQASHGPDCDIQVPGCRPARLLEAWGWAVRWKGWIEQGADRWGYLILVGPTGMPAPLPAAQAFLESVAQLVGARLEQKAMERTRAASLREVRHSVRDVLSVLKTASVLLKRDLSGEVVGRVQQILERQAGETLRLLEDGNWE